MEPLLQLLGHGLGLVLAGAEDGVTTELLLQFATLVSEKKLDFVIINFSL